MIHWEAFPAYTYKHSSLVKKISKLRTKSFITLAAGMIMRLRPGAYPRVAHLQGASVELTEALLEYAGTIFLPKHL
jgi:hypothetical protein